MSRMSLYSLSSRMVLLACLLQTARAGQVTLNNGDRLTGTILKSDDKTLSLKTEFAGTVVIDWAAVSGIISTERLNVSLKGGQMLVGPVATLDGKFVIQTSNAGAVSTSKEAISGIRSKDEAAKYEAELERLRNPSALDLWAGFMDAGLSTARGNANTLAANVTVDAVRATSRDKLDFTFNSLYASNSTAGPTVATANAKRGGVKYDLNVNKKLFGFGFTTLEADQFQKVDLRWVAGGGFGYHAIKTDRVLLDLSGGGSVNKVFYSTGARQTSGEALIGDELAYKLSKSFAITQKFFFFPNVTDAGQYRFNFDLGAVSAIRKWLSWQVTLSDRYISNPLTGTKKDDLLLTTGVRLTLAPAGKK